MTKFRLARITLQISVSALISVLSVRAVSAYVTSRQFSTTGAIVQKQWSASAFPIKWQLNPIQGKNVTGSRSQETVLKASFAAWEKITTATVSFTEGSFTDTNKYALDAINMVTTSIAAADYPSDALGLTRTIVASSPGAIGDGRSAEFAGQIIEADIAFNPDPNIQFSTDDTTPAGKIDLQSVATHEVGHFLGMDHASLLSSTMFWTLTSGVNYARTLSADDMAGVSTIYPSASFNSKGTISGTVRTTSNTIVYGAIVTAVNANGQPVASAITDPSGKYTIAGLDTGSYTIYAQPLTGLTTAANIATLTTIFPGSQVFTNFTVRFK